MIKYRNGKDLTEAEKTKRWQEYKNYTKQVFDPKNHDVIDISTPLAKTRKKGLGKAVLILSGSEHRAYYF